MLNQRKIALAVLFKLHQRAEECEGAISSSEIGNLFDGPVSIPRRRLQFALEELEGRGEIVREQDRYAPEETVWDISRSGMDVVDRALRVPQSFISRLAQNGDQWLNSDEAEAAVLQKSQTRASMQLAEEEAPQVHSATHPVVVNNTFSPTTEQKVSISGAQTADRSATVASWFGAWGNWLAAIVALAALLWTLHIAKVF